MPKLALVYGLRLLPADELDQVGDATLKLKNGSAANVAMHLLEADDPAQLREQLMNSLDAFFEFYPHL